MVYQATLRVHTSGHRDMHDMTVQVGEIVTRSGVRTGTVHVFSVGNSAVVGTIEYESGLKETLPAILDKFIPPSRRHSHSHLQASLIGPSLTAPISDGRLALGTSQQIFHLECDVRPREREIVVTVHGE